MSLIIQRWLFRIAFILNQQAIGRQCWNSLSYYSYTRDLIRELFTGYAREHWFNRLDALMSTYGMEVRHV